MGTHQDSLVEAVHAVRVHTERGVTSQSDFPGFSRALLFATAESKSFGVIGVEVLHGQRVVWSSFQGTSDN